MDKLDFFPLDRAMSLLGHDDDETDTRLDDLMETLKEIKDKQDREVSSRNTSPCLSSLVSSKQIRCFRQCTDCFSSCFCDRS